MQQCVHCELVHRQTDRPTVPVLQAFISLLFSNDYKSRTSIGKQTSLMFNNNIRPRTIAYHNDTLQYRKAYSILPQATTGTGSFLNRYQYRRPTSLNKNAGRLLNI